MENSPRADAVDVCSSSSSGNRFHPLQRTLIGRLRLGKKRGEDEDSISKTIRKVRSKNVAILYLHCRGIVSTLRCKYLNKNSFFSLSLFFFFLLHATADDFLRRLEINFYGKLR